MERGMRMLTIEALNAYGADTQAGLRRCLGDESFYLGLVEMLVCDEKFELLAAAVRQRELSACLCLAYALMDTAAGLGLTPLTEQLEKLILCLRLAGDGAVLDKQHGLLARTLLPLQAIQEA